MIFIISSLARFVYPPMSRGCHGTISPVPITCSPRGYVNMHSCHVFMFQLLRVLNMHSKFKNITNTCVSVVMQQSCIYPHTNIVCTNCFPFILWFTQLMCCALLSLLLLGNNLYGDALREKLVEIRNSSERMAYILMDKVCPPFQVGAMCKVYPVMNQKCAYFGNLCVCPCEFSWVTLIIFVVFPPSARSCSETKATYFGTETRTGSK